MAQIKARKKEKCGAYRKNCNTIDIKPNISVITLHVNRLNMPINRPSLSDYSRIKQLHAAYEIFP